MPLTVLSVSYPLARVSSNTAGGAEQVLAIIDSALVRAGHRSLVLAPAGSRCSGLLIPARVPTGVLDHSAKREAHQEFKKLVDLALERYPVDLVHMHGIDFNRYLPEREVPIVVTLHLPLSWYAGNALRFVPPNVSLICVSRSQQGTAASGVPVHGVIVNGVDLEAFRLREKRQKYALVMTRICPEKGIHLAIEAAELAGIDLMIAGAVFEYPEHRRYFDSMIRPKLNKHIRFLGPVGGVRKADLLSGASCLLVPSLAPETSCLVAMEAMAAGTPVVAFPVGALGEIVTHGRTGFLVDGVQQMASAISNAHSISADVCRREAEQKFSAARMFAQYFKLYRSILNRDRVCELQAA